jgi:hypothetical protein
MEARLLSSTSVPTIQPLGDVHARKMNYKIENKSLQILSANCIRGRSYSVNLNENEVAVAYLKVLSRHSLG